MVSFNFEDKTVNLPTSWDEVTVAMFINPLFLSGDSLGLLAALADVPAEKLLNTTEDLTPYFDECLKFIKSDPQGWQRGAMTETLTVLDTVCTIPQNIELERFGQKVMFGQALANNKDNIYNALPTAIAIYLAPQIHPGDWAKRIPEIEAAVLSMSIDRVYSIGIFFLRVTAKYRSDGIAS